MSRAARLSEFQAITEALERRSEVAGDLDTARALLMKAAKKADDPETRGAHVRILRSVSEVDEARASLVGSDD